MDVLRKAIAGAVQTALSEPYRFAAAIDPANIEVSEISELETMIRIDQGQRGPRYFNVRVSESI